MILANAELILPGRVMRGAVHIENGRIAELTEGDTVPAGAEDLGGDWLAPGLVELHTDNLERHLQPRPGAHFPHGPAILAHDAELAACGITTVFDALRLGSIAKSTRDYARYARDLADEMIEVRASGALKIDHKLHLRAEICSETLADELGEFGQREEVGIISIMDHSPGQRQYRDPSKLVRYVRGKHGMNEAEADAHLDQLRDIRARHGDAFEEAAIRRAGELGAVLASHDDTTRAQVETSAAHGIGLAEFPTTIEAAEACRAHGIAIMMGAPNLIRGGSHTGNVAASELAELGLLDIISSDYVPASLIGSAFRLAAIWDDLPRAFATVSRNPARAAGLADRGEIAPGQRADLIRLRKFGTLPSVRATWVEGVRV
ncbi:MAG: alpha-D-ribose 1-methylphosphonate 5-triphosphate diphosphatase [Paracoccus sp. (in: a-proteobacteria)]|nr:alpha-D-ribose 1-methylphosphonate 5-triphosphate diphosphatase [Paracoccus sp. (in: a-proteobacteria)]